MKNTINSFATLFLIIFSFNANAQKHNVELSFGRYYIFNEDFNKQSIYHQTGIGYSYAISKKIKIKANFILSPFTVMDIFSSSFSKPGRSMSSSNMIMSVATIGEIEHRLNGYIFDIEGIYDFFKERRNCISFSIGLSSISTKNAYLTNYIHVPGIEDVVTIGEYKRDWYFGGVVGLRYDYSFAKNRMNFGTFCNARVYYDFPFQINYGIHLGYNF